MHGERKMAEDWHNYGSREASQVFVMAEVNMEDLKVRQLQCKVRWKST